MNRRWVAFGLIGVGAAAAIGILAYSGKAEAAPTPPLTWYPLYPVDGVFELQAGVIYGISDNTQNLPIPMAEIRASFEESGFRVLDLTQMPPRDWPKDDREDGQAYLIFAPETNKPMPASALGATGRMFVLA